MHGRARGMTRRLATVAAALLVAVTVGAPGASAEDTPTDLAGGRAGLYPPVLEKAEDTPYLTPSSVPGAVPSVSLREEPVAAAAGLAAGAVAAGKGCLPYSVHALVRIVDEQGRVVVSDYIRFRQLWCDDGVRDITPTDGTCETYPSALYRPGAGRCWWSKGLWGGPGFSFRTGATYHVHLTAHGVTLSPDPVTIVIDHGAVWWGPGTEIQHDRQCADPEGLPRTWNVTICDAYVSRDW